MDYLTRLFRETYFKDIIERNKIAKIQELEDLVDILAPLVGSLTNPPKIEAAFKSAVNSSISLATSTTSSKPSSCKRRSATSGTP